MKLFIKNNRFFYLGLLLTGHVLLSLSIRYTAWPEMLAYPWLVTQGFKLYGDIIHPYLPLLPLFLSHVFQLLGFSIFNLQLITLGFFLVIDVLLFLIVEKLHSRKSAIISTLFFIGLTAIPDGNSLWFDLVCIPFLLGAFFWLHTHAKKQTLRNILFAGLCIGGAVLVKQTSVIFIIPAFFQLKEKKHVWTLVLGSVLPLIGTILLYYVSSQFQDFWYWAIVHPLFVHGRMPGFALLPNKRELLILAVLFAPLVFILRKNPQRVIWIIAAFLFAFPRFAYFHLLPAGAFFTLSLPLWNAKKMKKLLLFYVFLCLLLFGNWFKNSVGKPVRFFEPEIIAVRNEIIEKIPAGERALFFNVPANFFVLTSLVPSQPWADTFPWYLEVPGVQSRIVENLSEVNYVLFSPFSLGDEFALGAYQPAVITSYVTENFYPAEKLANGFFILKRRN